MDTKEESGRIIRDIIVCMVLNARVFAQTYSTEFGQCIISFSRIGSVIFFILTVFLRE